MTDWVRFHRELCEGDKRGLSRATRFVYMELSRLARKRRGWVPLPIGMSDVEGVCDILAGNRKEAVKAVSDLTKPGDEMISFGEREGKRCVIVPSWKVWNPIDETAAQRQANHRAVLARKAAAGTAKSTRDDVVSHDDVTRDSRSDIGRVTEPRARTLISSLSSSSDRNQQDPEREGSGLRGELSGVVGPVPAVLPMPAEAAEYAATQGVHDFPGEWVKWSEHHRSRGTMAEDWTAPCPGLWKKWLVDAVRFQRRERDRDRAKTEAREAESRAASDERASEVRKRERTRDREYDDLKREAVPAPIGDLMAAIGGKKP